MQKTNSFLLLIILLSGIFSSCKTGPDESSWTSMDPLSIPLKIRQSEYNKGNLVRNPSFEQVKIGENDSLIHHFSLSNWEVVGKDVQLTDITRKNIYDSTEAFGGIHAVKIVRTDQDVKEINNPSEGVLSDFIEVIPANYDFYFDIRLEKIIPTSYLDRFQNRIGKDIDIHLKFYDKNKKEISPGIYFEYIHKKVDNSFKGFAFSNFFYIDKFDWARVHGESWVYPFSEGDMPAGCRYIKIFLGLKCSGTMWIDNIDFRLSRWSFTPMERMDSMFNKKYDLTELMIPTPKVITNQQHIDLKNKDIQLVYEGTASPESKAALALLQQRFGRLHGDSIKIYHSSSDSSGLQIVLVKDQQNSSVKFKEAFQKIKGKDQGYFIRKESNKIYLGANQLKGLFYAASSLCQLIDYTNATLDYADITDYPDFTGRSSLLMAYQNKWTLEQDKSLSDSALRAALEKRNDDLKKQIEDIDFYAFYKINELYSLYFILSRRWWQPGDFYKTLFDEVGKRCAEYGDIIHTAVQINPYFHIAMEQRVDTLSDSLRELFSHATNDGFEKIKNALKPALDGGAKTVMVCADDYVPHSGIIRGEYVLFNKEDKEKFINLADAQDYMLNKLRAWLDKTYGNIRLEFVPPPYNNRFIDYGMGSAETYFRDLSRHLDSSVILVWTGNTIRSLSYDLADIRRGTEVYKRKPMIWDNSPYARIVESANGGYPINYPGKSILCDLFEPFDIQYPENFPAYVDSRYYSNLGGFGEINKIKYMTFADFTWNTKDYNPDFSLFKALVQYVGVENAKLLLKFNDAYFQFVSDWAQLRMDVEHDSAFNYTAGQKAQAEQKIKAMKKAFDALKPVDNDALKKELEHTMNAKIDAWRKLCEVVSGQQEKRSQ
jgi:hypothetical protein